MVIDVHAHYMPKAHLTKYKSLFDLRETDKAWELYVNGRWIDLERGLFDLSAQVGDMERTGINQRLLSSYAQCFYYEKEEAVAWNKSYNDGVIQDIAPYNDKFLFLATLPMCSIKEACQELERVMAMPPVVGVQIATNIAGKELDDAELEDFWALAARLNAFILLHPAYVVSTPRFKQYHLGNIIGNPLDTTIAAFRLMVGGVLDRHPSLSICLSHTGGYLPFAMSRFDHGRRVRAELAHLSNKPSELAKKLYYDTIIHDAACLEFAIERLGADRFLLGSDYPFDMSDPESVRTVNDISLSEGERLGILSFNVQRIIKKI